MITVAAMLSAEHVFAAAHGPDVSSGLAPDGLGGGRGGPRGSSAPGAAAASESARDHIKRLMQEVQGDHLLLLRLYQLWAMAGHTRDFAKSYGLDLRGMNFAKDIRRQLEGGCGVDIV
jgi:ATP-dependent RNA helicase DHX8/PRP22